MNTQQPASRMTTSGASVASLVLGILSFLGFGFLTGIPAVICGHVGRSRIRAADGSLDGAGIALAGLILGYIASVTGLVILSRSVALPQKRVHPFVVFDDAVADPDAGLIASYASLGS